MLPRLSILRDTRLKLPSSSCHNQHSTVSLQAQGMSHMPNMVNEWEHCNRVVQCDHIPCTWQAFYNITEPIQCTDLGGPCNHVLDEITMPWGINNSDVVLGSLKLPQGNVDGDTTFPLSLQLVQNPGILEGAFSHLQQHEKVKMTANGY